MSPKQVFNRTLVSSDDLGDARGFLDTCCFDDVVHHEQVNGPPLHIGLEMQVDTSSCLLYTSDAADDW